jgi:uncharacterized membrane protein YbhN (UPF0104 family)
MKRFNTVLLALGFGCLLYLIEMTGWRQLWHQFTALGWGITLIILAEGAANVAHTVGWRHCISSSQKQLPLWRLFRINMAGWAINYLTPTASIGGEVTRASLLAGQRDGTDAVGSVFLDKLTTAVAHLLLVAMGAVLLSFRVKLPPQLWIAMAATTALITVGIVAFLLFQTSGTMETAGRWLVRHKLGGRIAERALSNLSKVDGVLRQFYRDHPRDLMLSVLWHALGHSVALAHTWLFLTLIGSPAPLVMVAAAAPIAGARSSATAASGRTRKCMFHKARSGCCT